jgi:hypothetical protein
MSITIPRSRARTDKTRVLSEVRVPLTMPRWLWDRLQALAERDCASVTATTRRLIAAALERELGRAE